MTLHWFVDFAQIVVMDKDYTTESGNLGERMYEAGKAYQVCPTMRDEIISSGCGKLALRENFKNPSGFGGFAFPPEGIPVRPLVSVVPKVSKALSSNGRDLFFIESGKQVSLPSNLAQHLISTNQATAS